MNESKSSALTIQVLLKPTYKDMKVFSKIKTHGLVKEKSETSRVSPINSITPMIISSPNSKKVNRSPKLILSPNFVNVLLPPIY